MVGTRHFGYASPVSWKADGAQALASDGTAAPPRSHALSISDDIKGRRFACSECGACCKLAPRAHAGWPKRADGACLYLTPENRCAIYESRPRICRVDALRPAAIPVESWHAMNAEACAELQKVPLT